MSLRIYTHSTTNPPVPPHPPFYLYNLSSLRNQTRWNHTITSNRRVTHSRTHIPRIVTLICLPFAKITHQPLRFVDLLVAGAHCVPTSLIARDLLVCVFGSGQDGSLVQGGGYGGSIEGKWWFGCLDLRLGWCQVMVVWLLFLSLSKYYQRYIICYSLR